MFIIKTLLVTGGTGSFGKSFVIKLLTKYSEIKKIIIYSRDELKQFEFNDYLTKLKLKKNNYRFFIGDVRDKDRVKYALKDVDYVVHAAALKHVPAAEYNPFEFIKTNVIGAQNIIEASLEANVQKVIALSTDKASSPINLYGATKLCSDKLFIAAQNYSGKKNIKFSVVRYGNVLGSRGSIIPILIKAKDEKYFRITHKEMTRFNITLDAAVNFVIDCLKNTRGGEIFIPKLKSYRILDICKAMDENKLIKILGIRPGEKLHEQMFSEFDCENIIEDNKKYIILQPKNNNTVVNYSSSEIKSKKLNKIFSYNSRDNKSFLKVKEIKNLVQNFHNETLF
jgi:UDP-N-acetylglucosamine 4,6-dehydratase (inverting)